MRFKRIGLGLALMVASLGVAASRDNGGVTESKRFTQVAPVAANSFAAIGAGGSVAHLAAPSYLGGLLQSRSAGNKELDGYLLRDRLRGATLLVKHEGGHKSLWVPHDVLNQFDVLKELLEVQSESTGSNEINLEFAQVVAFENLLKIINTGRVDGYTAEQLIGVLELADFLAINDYLILQPVLHKIKSDASLDLVKTIHTSGAYDVMMSLSGEWEPETSKRLTGVGAILWQPNGEHYWVQYMDGTAQLYTATGEMAEDNLRSVSSIIWRPDGGYYWVRQLDGFMAQVYTERGTPIGGVLTEMVWGEWQPEGAYYWIRFLDHVRGAQVYTAAGVPVGGRLSFVKWIAWKPDGGQYCVYYNNDTVQRYTVDGIPAGPLLENAAYLTWEPNSTDYWVRHADDQTFQRYTEAGLPVGERLANLRGIVWQPNYAHYVEFYLDGGAQLYTADHQAVGERLSNVESFLWQPHGDHYFTISRDRKAQLYFDNQPTGLELNNVENIYWQPNGNGFWVKHTDYTTQFYKPSKYSKLSLKQSVLVEAIKNLFSNTKKPVALEEELLGLLPANIIEMLVDNGYLQLPSGGIVEAKGSASSSAAGAGQA